MEDDNRPTLTAGDALPFFDIVTVEGPRVAYKQFWQQQNVVLVSLSAEGAVDDRQLVAALVSRRAEFDALRATCLVTRDLVSGVPHPGVVVADRWGEVHSVAAVLPDPQALLDTLEYLQHRCPECEGESR
jgi:hypothetical protein